MLAIFESIVYSSASSSAEFKRIQSHFSDAIDYKKKAIRKVQLTHFSDMKEAVLQVPLWDVPDHRLVIQITRSIRNHTDCIEAVVSALRAIGLYDDLLEGGSYDSNIEDAMYDRIDDARNKLYVMHDSAVSVIERCDELLAS